MTEESTNEKYVLTPWGCLYATLIDYGVDVSHITGTIGGHLVDDFMDAMVKAGYLDKAGEVDGEETLEADPDS